MSFFIASMNQSVLKYVTDMYSVTVLVS